MRKNAREVQSLRKDRNPVVNGMSFVLSNEKRKKREKGNEKVWDFSDLNQGPVDLQSNALPAAPKSHLMPFFFKVQLQL